MTGSAGLMIPACQFQGEGATKELRKRGDLPLGGFAGLKEYRPFMDGSVLGPINQACFLNFAWLLLICDRNSRL